MCTHMATEKNILNNCDKQWVVHSHVGSRKWSRTWVMVAIICDFFLGKGQGNDANKFKGFRRFNDRKLHNSSINFSI